MNEIEDRKRASSPNHNSEDGLLKYLNQGMKKRRDTKTTKHKYDITGLTLRLSFRFFGRKATME